MKKSIKKKVDKSIPKHLHHQLETDCIYSVYLKRQKEDIRIYQLENNIKIPTDFEFNITVFGYCDALYASICFI